MDNNRTNIRNRGIIGRVRPRIYPRHFTINGTPYLGKTVAVKLVPSEVQVNSAYASDQPDELKVGDLVIFGEKDTIQITVAGEKYLIAYRNRLIKFI